MAQGTLPLRAPLRLSSEAFPALQAELVTPPPPGPPVPLSRYHVVSLLSLFGDLQDIDIEIHVCCAELLHSCPTLCDPMDCSPPGSSIHETLQTRILE